MAQKRISTSNCSKPNLKHNIWNKLQNKQGDIESSKHTICEEKFESMIHVWKFVCAVGPVVIPQLIK